MHCHHFELLQRKLQIHINFHECRRTILAEGAEIPTYATARKPPNTSVIIISENNKINKYLNCSKHVTKDSTPKQLQLHSHYTYINSKYP